MKVRTKIALLLFIVVAIFVGGLIAVKAHDRERFREVVAAHAAERQRSFDAYVEHAGESLATFVKYFSTWDEMVSAIAQENPAWVDGNLGEHTLNSYRAHFAWAYRSDGSLAFTRKVIDCDGLGDVPLPPGALPRLFEKASFCRFFALTPVGTMEICGTTVHPSRDNSRAGPHRGYFFAGRLWSNQDLKEMGLSTGDELRIVSLKNLAAAEPESGEPSGTVKFSRPLRGWDGLPIAALAVRNASPVIDQLMRSSERQFWSLLVFAIVVFLALLFSLTQWVTRPLKKLSIGLKTQDPVRIRALQKGSDEFGDFSRVMGAFFEQRRDLVREMSERVHTQQALHDSEERLRQSQKMEAVGRLAGGIAHDFNNLLTAIIGYAELIALGSTERTIREEADMIRKAGGQAADLTRQLLAFSRKQVLQPRVLDLNALLVNLQKLLQRLIGEHIDLRVEPGAEKARVRADPTQLEQVVMNLAVNARDAMPRGGTLTLRTASIVVTAEPALDALDAIAQLPPGRYLVLTAHDDGIGMDGATRERVFEPFFTTKPAGKGTGLGLATVYGIVQQSGGQIKVESEPGAGTTFTIYLPQVDAPLDLARPPSTVVRHARPAETVLVVEDEKIVRELVCAVLSEQGYDVICAAGGEPALRLAREHPRPVDLLLTDIIMPHMSGQEVAHALHREQPHAKVLFVSGYTDEILSDTVSDPTELRFLEKPFTPESLCRKVREVLDEPALSTI